MVCDTLKRSHSRIRLMMNWMKIAEIANFDVFQYQNPSVASYYADF